MQLISSLHPHGLCGSSKGLQTVVCRIKHRPRSYHGDHPLHLEPIWTLEVIWWTERDSGTAAEDA